MQQTRKEAMCMPVIWKESLSFNKVPQISGFGNKYLNSAVVDYDIIARMRAIRW